MVDLTKHRSDELAQNSSLEKNKSSSYDRQTKDFLITINNPSEYGFTHEKIIELIHTKIKNVQYFCMCDEMGRTYHTHIYILLTRKKRWSAMRRLFNHCHLEPEIRGSAQENRAYIKKEGKKHQSKAETNYPETFYEEGELPKYNISNDRAKMLLQIEEMIEENMRPEEIMSQCIVYRQYESIIKKAYFSKRLKETPPLRQIKIVWHLGASGSGKSFSYTELCNQYGEDEVYFASDYSNSCTALFDGYEGQRILFLDEIKTDSFKYGLILQIFQGYKTQIHSRYNNVYSLWTEIHATSVFTPEELYEHMFGLTSRSIDSKTQLLRRILEC